MKIHWNIIGIIICLLILTFGIIWVIVDSKNKTNGISNLCKANNLEYYHAPSITKCVHCDYETSKCIGYDVIKINDKYYLVDNGGVK